MSAVRYTKDHEWILMEDGDIGVIGITDYAQEQLGELVYVELPELEQEIGAGGDAVVIESVKAAGEVKAPVNGTVTELVGLSIDFIELRDGMIRWTESHVLMEKQEEYPTETGRRT